MYMCIYYQLIFYTPEESFSLFYNSSSFCWYCCQIFNGYTIFLTFLCFPFLFPLSFLLLLLLIAGCHYHYRASTFLLYVLSVFSFFCFVWLKGICLFTMQKCKVSLFLIRWFYYVYLNFFQIQCHFYTIILYVLAFLLYMYICIYVFFLTKESSFWIDAIFMFLTVLSLCIFLNKLITTKTLNYIMKLYRDKEC